MLHLLHLYCVETCARSESMLLISIMLPTVEPCQAAGNQGPEIIVKRYVIFLK